VAGTLAQKCNLTELESSFTFNNWRNGEVVGNHVFWGAIRHRYSAKRDSLTNERISKSPALVNIMEKVIPTKFSIRVFGSVSRLGSQTKSLSLKKIWFNSRLPGEGLNFQDPRKRGSRTSDASALVLELVHGLHEPVERRRAMDHNPTSRSHGATSIASCVFTRLWQRVALRSYIAAIRSTEILHGSIIWTDVAVLGLRLGQAAVSSRLLV